MLRWTFSLKPGVLLALLLAGLHLSAPLSGQTWLNLAADTPLPWGLKGLLSAESRWSPSGHSTAFLDLDVSREIRSGSGWWADGQLRLLHTNRAAVGYCPERRLAFRLIRKIRLSDRNHLRIRGMYQHARALPEPFNDAAISAQPPSEALRLRVAYTHHIYKVPNGPEWKPELNAEWFMRRSGGFKTFESTNLRVRAELHWKPTTRQTLFVGYQGEWPVSGARPEGSDVFRAGCVWHCQ
jgi:hypothetical protein